MCELPNGGGEQPPNEPEVTLDEKLDADIRDASDQVEAVDPDPPKKPDSGWIAGIVVGAFFFGLSIWWDSGEGNAVPAPLPAPEVNIGVDPNTANVTATK